MTIKNKPISTYTFADLNQDLNEFYDVLTQENFKNCEIQRLLNPIISKIPEHQPKTFKIFPKTTLVIFSFILSIYLLTYCDSFYWNLTALTRILMIRILPYFDWRYLKNEACLVPKLFDHLDQKIPTEIEEIFNCDLCESLHAFNQITFDLDRDIEDLIRKFVDVDRPVIVKGGIDHWIKKSPKDFIEDLMVEKQFLRSVPCKISTNIHNLRRGKVDIEALVKRAEYFDSFFMHFQNCEIEAVRIFRKYTYRPKVLPLEFSPVSYNWLLWNKRDNSTIWKKIELVEKYTLIGQIFGNTKVRLIPRKNCEKLCPIFEGILPGGHFIMLTSLWDIEYLPDGSGENLAAILELKG